MTSTQLQPYELPPFELVKLISSAFAPHTSPAVSPQIPSLSAFSSSTSPHARAGPSSPPSAGKDGTSRQHQHASLTGRLSQLTSKGSVSLSPPSSSNTGFASGSPSGSSTHAIASPELETPRLGPAQAITTGQDVLLSSHAPSAAKPPQSIKAVQAGTESVWIGGNEGSIAVWQLDLTRAKSKGKERAQTDHNVAGSAEEAAYLLDQYNVVPGRRPIEKLAVLPTVGKAVVLSEGILTLHALPTFSNLVAFPPVRGVSTFAVDLSDPNAESVRLCIIKRKTMQLLSISHSQVDMLKELPLRTTAILAVLRGSYLCIADAVNYSLVNLDSATLTPLLPISQDPTDSPPSELHNLTPSSAPAIARPKSHQRPAILPIENDEFLVANHTGSSTLGLFIKENGEPTRGTLEWASNVRSMVVDHPYIVALLQNNTIEVHSIENQEIIQTLQVSSLATRHALSPEGTSDSVSPSTASQSAERIQPRSLISTTSGFASRFVPLSKGDPAFAPLLVPQVGHMNSLEKIEVRFFPKGSSPAYARGRGSSGNNSEPDSAPIGPPSTPKKGSALSAARPTPVRSTSKYLSTVAAKTLLVGKDSVFALCPLTLVVQAEALISNSRVEDALNLLAAVGKPDTPEKLDEFCYIKQKAAWKLLSETRFAEAGKLFLQGRADPRLLIRLFPNVRGSMYASLNVDTVAIFKGLALPIIGDHLSDETIDDIIRNYSPHLPPSSPTVTDLHGKLEKDARRMLRNFLEAWRTERRRQGAESVGMQTVSDGSRLDIDRLVDTALVKLYLQEGRKRQVIEMLDRGEHCCDVDEIAPMLQEASLHWHLSQMLLVQHRFQETLKIWTELVDGERTDPLFKDGPGKVFNLLENSTDTELVTEYGLWLVGKDRDLGLKVLMGPIQGAKIEVERCLSSLSSINKTAAELYLEFAVFTRKDTASTLHEQLINQYLDRLSHLFASTDLKSEIDVARQEYATTVNTSEVTIVSFTLSKARQSESMNTRAKLILLLHGSVVYDALAVQTRLDSLPGLLFEQALVAGRLSQHEQVLTILANKLQDLASAEAYCTHAGNGDILSARNVRELLQFLQLSPYPSALYRKDGRRKASKQTNTPLTPAQKEEKRKNLLNKLIKIQLEQCSPLTASLLDQQRTAHVIETQAIRISAKDILNSIPDDWPLPLMQNFLIRSLRRSLHTRYEKKLVKAVLQSQTLDSSLRYWAATERLGGVLAEEADDEPEANTQGEKSSAPSSDDVVYLEKGPLSYADDEKTVEVD